MEDTKKFKKLTKMQKLTILVAAGLILVVAPAIYFVMVQVQKSDQLVADEKIVTVVYGEEGFIPKYLKISKDTKVVWVNQESESNTTLQIVANKGDNNQFNDFGAAVAISLNDTYTYRFDKLGTLYYRNNRLPDHSGTIEVTQ